MFHIVATGGALPIRRLSLFPEEMKFFAFLEQQAENIVKMAQQLKDMVTIWQNVKERANVLSDMEQDGDAITHNMMMLLHRSFIPPIDKEDVSSLAHSLDDIADRIHEVSDTLEALKKRNLSLGHKIIADDSKINQKRFEIEKNFIELTAAHRPFISGPNAIAAILNLITELERIGDYAARYSRSC